MAFALASHQAVLTRPGAPAVRPTVASRRSLCIVAAKGGEEGGKTFDKSVAGILCSNANFTVLASGLGKAGLEKTLMGTGPFTVFAPDDDAMAAQAKKLGVSKIELLTHPGLPDILKYHVVAGKVTSKDLSEGQELETLGGKKISVSLAGGVKVSGVKVVRADFPASNGVIHKVAEVLQPQ